MSFVQNPYSKRFVKKDSPIGRALFHSIDQTNGLKSAVIVVDQKPPPKRLSVKAKEVPKKEKSKKSK